jgi:hypothetical protein
MLGAGIGLVILGVLASIRRPQVLTLAVSRDGLRMRGDLAGTGLVEPWLDGGHLVLPRKTDAGDDR